MGLMAGLDRCGKSRPHRDFRSPLGFYKPEIRVLGPGWPNCKPYVALRLLAFKSVLDRFWCVRAAHRNLRVKRKSVTLFDHIIL